jgi:hypothetical protein
VRARLGLLALLVASLGLPSAPAAADSFTPVRLGVTVTPVARRHARLPISINVGADPGVLDSATTPLRIEVKLAAECGATFQTTPGTVLLNKALSPQPPIGKPYSETMRGSGRPSAFGVQTVCVFLQEQGDGGREFAQDESNQVNVSPRCTSTAGRFDSEREALSRAQRRLRRARRGTVARRRDQKLVAQRTRTLNADRKAGRRACGAAVAL